MDQVLCCPACGHNNDEQALWCAGCLGSLAGVTPQPVAAPPHLERLDAATLQPTGELLAVTQLNTPLVLGRSWNGQAPDLDIHGWLTPHVAAAGRQYGVSRRQLVVRHADHTLHITREGAATTVIWLGGDRGRTTSLETGRSGQLRPGDVLVLGDPWADPARRAPGLLLRFAE